MRLVISGFDHAVEFGATRVGSLSIENNVLFARVCQSLLSGLGEDAVEPYSLWGDDGERVRPESAFLPIVNPFELPWDERGFAGKLQRKLCDLLLEDEGLRSELELLSETARSRIHGLSLQLEGSHSFAVEWDMAKYVKAFGFGVDVSQGKTLLDSLILFIDCISDLRFEEALLFVNLRAFLSTFELQEFYDRVFYHEIPVLLLDNAVFVRDDGYENDLVVDQHFLESGRSCRLECSSSSQRGICSNGFGAVTF